MLLKQKEDTNKVNILNNLCFEYLYIDTAKSSYYNQTALNLAYRLNFKKGVALSLSNLGRLVSLLGKYNEALKYYQQALAIFKETNDRKNTAVCYTDIAIAYWYLSDYLKCIELNNLTLEIADTVTDKKVIACAYTSLGVAYTKLGNYPKALKYFFLSLAILESLNEYKKIACCYNNIAIIYRNQNDLDNAIKYYTIAIELYKKNDNNKDLATCYNNVGGVYVNKNKNYEAIKYFNLALQIYRNLGYKYGIGAATSNIGEAYVNLKDYNAAKRFYEEALTIRNEISDSEGISLIFNNLSQLHLNLSDTKQAKFYAEKGLKIAADIKCLSQMNTAYKLLSQIAEKENNFQEAYLYLNLYQISSDSLFSIEKTKEIENIKNSYELDKKDLEIQTITQKHEMTQQINLKNRYLLISIIVFLLLLIVSAGVFINRKRLKNRQEKQISLARQTVTDLKIINTELENEKINNELLFRKKEVANLAINIIEKNNLIKEIIDKISKVQQEDNYSSALKALRSSVKIINLNKSREDFYIQVGELHKDFFHTLSEKYPELTKNEKKLAALLLMEISSNDISTILNISTKSVEQNRYRLRRKLNLDAEINLTDFFKNIT
ncbi:MAG: DUF2225 domain-containing protein [Bacteroidales bacterium]